MAVRVVKLETLEEAISRSWGKDTSLDADNWTPENPAWGQCAVTACVVQDYLGGDLVWANATLPGGKTLSHYWNKDTLDGELDLTRKQFPEGTIVPVGAEKKKQFGSTREYVLSFEKTMQRYNALSEKVNRELEGKYEILK